jgi:hypothetical protein
MSRMILWTVGPVNLNNVVNEASLLSPDRIYSTMLILTFRCTDLKRFELVDSGRHFVVNSRDDYKQRTSYRGD